MGIQDTAQESTPVMCPIHFVMVILALRNHHSLGERGQPSQHDHKLQISAHLLKRVAYVGVS